VDLRLRDYTAPVIAAYIAALGRNGNPNAVDDLARSLGRRMHGGAKEAYQRAPFAFRHVTPSNLTDMALEAVTAEVDKQGRRWTLGLWADMPTHTLGRRASSRGTLPG
jgi:hypothetical protein